MIPIDIKILNNKIVVEIGKMLLEKTLGMENSLSFADDDKLRPGRV